MWDSVRQEFCSMTLRNISVSLGLFTRFNSVLVSIRLTRKISIDNNFIKNGHFDPLFADLKHLSEQHGSAHVQTILHRHYTLRHFLYCSLLLLISLISLSQQELQPRKISKNNHSYIVPWPRVTIVTHVP